MGWVLLCIGLITVAERLWEDVLDCNLKPRVGLIDDDLRKFLSI